ncbi:MAG: tannase/feruloyl esterase family alpha/beta hydrolase [Acidobacteria bacterium]|nr:tannase/feruloyl esterase family alpha/beta hydrolase [Acidobacteriota bacterium]
MIAHLALLFAAAAAPVPCESLGNIDLPGVTITAAELRPAGPPPAGAPGQAPASLPAHCRVAAVLAPSPDSHIEMELWLPADDWNGKFQAVGNGGWAGTISTPAMASALREGYATASTDTGHRGGNALFGIGHPEKVVDYAYRAVHEMTVRSKALITAHYGRPPALSYWNGCSTGGRQALMSAQRYPEDFDGIVAGAPANAHSRLHASDMALTVELLRHPAGKIPASKLPMLHRAVLAACDALDGVRDGLLEDPRKCRFDPAVLQCRGEEGDACLTEAQVETVRKMYAPVRTPGGGTVFPGKAPGSESAWYMAGAEAPSPISVGTFQLTYQDGDWDWRTFDAGRDTRLAEERTGFINAVDPDLGRFKARGGKLLLYHGWNDTGIAPGNTIEYYESVVSALGPDQGDWLRLFMVPGMGHCSGGDGPDQAGFMAALERWREGGESPERITAYRVTGNRVEMSRPLCPYPRTAHYKGIGSVNDAENFECRLP